MPAFPHAARLSAVTLSLALGAGASAVPAHAAPTPTPSATATAARSSATSSPTTSTPTASRTPRATPTATARAEAASAIDQRWAQLGGANGWVGQPTAAEYAVAGGRYRPFTGADIGWSSAEGAHWVAGRIRDKYRATGGPASFLGLPRTDEVAGPLPGTRMNHFAGGTILYTTPNGYLIYGTIRDRYLALSGWEQEQLGVPTTDEVAGPLPGSRMNRFQRGAIYWSAPTGAYAVYGEIDRHYGRTEVRTALGMPTSNERVGLRGSRLNTFRNGELIWSPATGAHAVYGQIGDRYRQNREALGLPTSDELPGGIPGVRLSNFQEGTIYWSGPTGAHEVYGAIAAHYRAIGAERSELGLPTRGEYAVPGGRATDFQYGRIVFTGGATRVELTRNPESSPLWTDCALTLNGVRVTWPRGDRSITVVNGTGGSYANLQFFVRRNSGCGYDRLVGATARVGYAGISDGVTRRQGSGTTPAGTYTLTESYGSRPNPGSGLPYRQYNSTDRWVMDSSSAYYNNFRNPSQGGFSTVNNEPLADVPVEYEYFIPVNFNRAPDFVRKDRGAGIFLHVHGPGATAGCISLTREEVLTVMRNVRPSDTITIAV